MRTWKVREAVDAVIVESGGFYVGVNCGGGVARGGSGPADRSFAA